MSRLERGQAIANIEGAVVMFIFNKTYRVKSQSGNGVYYVTNTELGWRCTCADHVHRGVKCRHIIAVEDKTKSQQESCHSRLLVRSCHHHFS